MINACNIKLVFSLLSPQAAAVVLPGVFILLVWVRKTSLGRKALDDSDPRSNSMPLYLPLIPLFISFGISSTAIFINREFYEGLPDWKNELVNNVVLIVTSCITVAIVIYIVREYFEDKLKGFGLNPRELLTDFPMAIVNLIAAYPLVETAIFLTILFGRLIQGREFQIQQHRELQIIQQHEHLSLLILVIFNASVVAPVLEEMLFRGLFQTALRTYVTGPWQAIFISSGVFAMVHADQTHWPALALLAVVLGYSYEKSGSLFRPILIHSLFNTSAVLAVLYQHAGNGGA